jgi:hypothetical protein
MLKEVARQEIVKRWQSWGEKTGKFSVDGPLFYAWLREHYSHLLKFKSAGDQWHVVTGWIQNAS